MTEIHLLPTLRAYGSVAATLLLCLCLFAAPASGEYVLHPGDTLEISAAAAGLNQKAVIGLDGEISLPLGGQIKVGGLSVSDAKEKITGAVANRVYQGPTVNGRDAPSLILPEDVVVTVAEYRPIYINGNVAKPGEYPFRPGMTAQQAVAMAGGVGNGSEANKPYMEEVDLRVEREALSTELANQQAVSWRLHNQLAQSHAASGAGAPAAANNHRFMRTERQQYEARSADHSEDQSFLRDAIAKINQQLNTLAESKKRLEQGNKADLGDYERVKVLYAKGLATVMRLSDARRVALASSDQILQINLQISNAERQRDEYVRQLDKLGSQGRIDDLKELQGTDLRIAEILARLKGIDEKLAYIEHMKSQLANGTGLQPTIIVTRSDDKNIVQLDAGSKPVPLEPGDVVNVSTPRIGPRKIAWPSENLLAPADKPLAQR